jgi:hypothetical protein
LPIENSTLRRDASSQYATLSSHISVRPPQTDTLSNFQALKSSKPSIPLLSKHSTLPVTPAHPKVHKEISDLIDMRTLSIQDAHTAQSFLNHDLHAQKRPLLILAVRYPVLFVTFEKLGATFIVNAA